MSEMDDERAREARAGEERAATPPRLACDDAEPLWQNSDEANSCGAEPRGLHRHDAEGLRVRARVSRATLGRLAVVERGATTDSESAVRAASALARVRNDLLCVSAE